MAKKKVTKKKKTTRNLPGELTIKPSGFAIYVNASHPNILDEDGNETDDEDKSDVYLEVRLDVDGSMAEGNLSKKEVTAIGSYLLNVAKAMV